MSLDNFSFTLPDISVIATAVSELQLSISASEFHGTLCGYIAANAVSSGDNWIRALVPRERREILLTFFDVYTISQHQIQHFDPEFQLLLPELAAHLPDCARAFSEWCSGFVQAVTKTGIGFDKLESEDAKNSMLHLTEFSVLDYERISIEEDDARALSEIIDYTRMAVLNIHQDLQEGKHGRQEKMPH